MTLFLTWLADELRAGGLAVVEYPGWQTRARGSGGYTAAPLCVMEHHTASPPSWDGQRDADYIAAGDPSAPLSNLYIDRAGRVWVIAAGATNTNGKGQALTFSRGTVPADSMNTHAVGIECGNNGVGEVWPRPQVDALIATANVVNARLGNRPSDIAGHVHYAVGRKIDPATAGAVEGPWQPRSINSSGSWNLDDMRAEHERRADAKGDDMPAPAVTAWGPGRLDVFQIGADGALWHRFYVAATDTWSDWESLGGVSTAGPAAAAWSAGRLDVFVNGDGRLWQRSYENVWSDWYDLGPNP